VRPRAARLVRLALVLGAGACSSSSQDNGALGGAGFALDCAADGADPDRAELDAWCANPHDASAIPDVATGAPFRFRADASGDPAPEPAVLSLATSSPTGWALTQPGWLGFIVWSGSDVLDFTHVHASPVATLTWETPPPATLDVGAQATLAVVPRDGDGGILAGELPCSFSTTIADVLGVTSGGRIATVVARAAGDATVTATCAGQPLTATFHVADSTSSDAAAGSEGGP
jgi:hypothetical protein